MTVATSEHIGQRSTLLNDLRIALPPADLSFTQDEEWCVIRLNGEWREIRLHDYDELFAVPGLYEGLNTTSSSATLRPGFENCSRPSWTPATRQPVRCVYLISVPETAWLAKNWLTWVSSS